MLAIWPMLGCSYSVITCKSHLNSLSRTFHLPGSNNSIKSFLLMLFPNITTVPLSIVLLKHWLVILHLEHLSAEYLQSFSKSQTNDPARLHKFHNFWGTPLRRKKFSFLRILAFWYEMECFECLTPWNTAMATVTFMNERQTYFTDRSLQ